jgi:predicted NBD/HSP70 family sugar kinase
MQNGKILKALQMIRFAGRLTRSEIALQLGVGFSMASKLTTELIDNNLVIEAGRSDVESGRPSNFLAINPNAGYAIGLDISGTHQKAVIVNLVGEVVASLSETEHIPANREAILESLINIIHRSQSLCQLPSCVLMGIGIGLWASVDPSTGTVSSWTETPTLSAALKDFPIRQALHSRINFPYIIVDDIVRNLGIAEVQYGLQQRSEEDFLYILADTGIGLAIMMKGVPYVGPFNISGELGHIPMEGLSTQCSCGNIGCLETVASINAINSCVQQRLNESNARSILRNIQDELTIQMIVDAAEEGDKLAYQELTRAGEYFGSALATIVNLFGSKQIIVGGALSKSSIYLDAARRNLRLQALSKISTGVRVEASQLNDLAGARGAAARVLNELFLSEQLNILNIQSSLSAS